MFSCFQLFLISDRLTERKRKRERERESQGDKTLHITRIHAQTQHTRASRETHEHDKHDNEIYDDDDAVLRSYHIIDTISSTMLVFNSINIR